MVAILAEGSPEHSGVGEKRGRLLVQMGCFGGVVASRAWELCVCVFCGGVAEKAGVGCGSFGTHNSTSCALSLITQGLYLLEQLQI